MINLISDTVTKPTAEMIDFMLQAEVGDDVFGEDPSVNRLESFAAGMFGMEAAMFCPSGTMTNQIAIKLHTNPLDEMICERTSHVYMYETGGYAFNSGVAVKLLDGTFGKIRPDQVKQAVNGDFDWLPKSVLCVIENSTNKGGGNFYNLDEMAELSKTCKEVGLKYHLDGARLFNVLEEIDMDTKEFGKLFDTISICLSKGLGAPVGSLLLGSAKDIKRGRRFRKVMGGGMRQAGYMAAAGLFALKNNRSKLKVDNERAKTIGRLLAQQKSIIKVSPVKTNIVIFELDKKFSAEFVVNRLKSRGILTSAFGPYSVRLVFHLDIDDSMFEEISNSLNQLDQILNQ